MLCLCFGFRLRAVAMTAAAGLLLAGCAGGTVAYDTSLSPAENQLRQSNARFNQTVGEGAATGALLGGIAGLAFGGKNRGQAALLGAAIGGAVGTGAGYAVARNNLSRSSTEAQFNDAIKQASADADAYRTSASASRQIANQAEAEAGRLRAQYQSHSITQEQYHAGLVKYRSDNEIISKQVHQAQEAAAAMRQDSQVASRQNGATLTVMATSIELSSQGMGEDSARLSRLLDGAP